MCVPELQTPNCDASIRDCLGTVIKVDKYEYDNDLHVFLKERPFLVTNAVSRKRVTNRETVKLLDTGKCVYFARNSVWTFAYDFDRKYYSTINMRSYREYVHEDFVTYK